MRAHGVLLCTLWLCAPSLGLADAECTVSDLVVSTNVQIVGDSCGDGATLLNGTECNVACAAGYESRGTKPRCLNGTFSSGNFHCVDTDGCNDTVVCGEGAVCGDIAAPATGYNCSCKYPYVSATDETVILNGQISCICQHGHYVGGECAARPMPDGMAPTGIYMLSDGVASSGAAEGDALLGPHRGNYLKTLHNCSGKPVFQLGGPSGPILYQPDNDSGGWMVGPVNNLFSCAATGYLASSAHGALCSESPDGEGCVGKWRELAPNGEWRGVPHFRADALECALRDPCCGIDCGAFGSCHRGFCVCNSSYTGDRCTLAPSYTLSGSLSEAAWDLATVVGTDPGGAGECANGYIGGTCASLPLPAGMAPAYSLAGGRFEVLRGTYVRTSQSCSGVPVFQLLRARRGGYYDSAATAASSIAILEGENQQEEEEPPMLFRPPGSGQFWLVGPKSSATACEQVGFYASFGVDPLTASAAAASAATGTTAAEASSLSEDGGVSSTVAAAPCPVNPAAGSCFGRWQVWNASAGAWQHDSSVVLRGMAESAYRGTYVRKGDDSSNGNQSTGEVSGKYCNGLPIYQRGGDSGPVLFRPVDAELGHPGWMVGPAASAWPACSVACAYRWQVRRHRAIPTARTVISANRLIPRAAAGGLM